MYFQPNSQVWPHEEQYLGGMTTVIQHKLIRAEQKKQGFRLPKSGHNLFIFVKTKKTYKG